MLRLIIGSIFLFAAASVQADFKLYGEARVGVGGVRHSDIDFLPIFSTFSVGTFINKNMGIEAFVDASLATDTDGIFELEVARAAGAAIRLQGNPTNSVQAYLLIGYVDFAIEQEENGSLGRRTVKQSFDGVRVSLGLNQRLQVIPGLIFGVEYRNYYTDSGIIVDGLSLGLRYELP